MKFQTIAERAEAMRKRLIRKRELQLLYDMRHRVDVLTSRIEEAERRLLVKPRPPIEDVQKVKREQNLAAVRRYRAKKKQRNPPRADHPWRRRETGFAT